ncbi:MAG: fibronectin type III domain-containing protein [Anaerolineales bacterium]
MTTWITDPTRFDVGNVDKHSLLLAPAERADVIVDFSKFAGKTLILYNDAPAAFPARVASYDYYTGAPDLSPVGAPTILPGYGPNTRTVMQIKIAAATPATAFNLTKLQTAFKHNASGTGVFELGQHPIIVGQAAYNSAYGTSFATSSNCNAPGSTLQRCDGLVRVNDTTSFGFNTLRGQSTKMTMPLQPKAIHDEMNATTFDEYGRMQANLGVEAQPPSPGAQNVTLYPYVNPSTELIDGTNLPTGDMKVTAISSATDGTQIWRITHNGVDTHPIHFHLFDVQLINRVTWDNIIITPDANELGWKDTVRVAPLEDTIVALRPIVPKVPFEVPNSVRPLNPMMPAGSTAMFNNVDPQGNPTNPITNQLVNFGWEYVYHCHILSHEEMDMMRPVSLALPPNRPDGLAYTVSGSGNTRQLTLTWNDNSITETAFVVQKSTDAGTTWANLATLQSPLDQPNTHGTRSFTDNALNINLSNQYRVVAQNKVGYGAEFPSMTVQSVSAVKTVDAFPPNAPSALSAVAVNTNRVDLTWTDNSGNETGFTIERALVTGGVTGAFTAIDGVGANVTTYTDPTVLPSTTYAYRIFAYNTAGNSPYSNVATVTTPEAGPTAPSNLTATLLSNPVRAQLSWTDNSNNENLFQVWRSTNNGAFTMIGTVTRTNTQRTATGGTVTFINNNLTAGTTYTYYVVAVNTVPTPDTFSVPSNTASVTLPAAPAAPSNLRVTGATRNSISLAWNDNSNNETGFEIQYRLGGANWQSLATVPANTTTFVDTGRLPNYTIFYRVRAINAGGTSAWSNTVTGLTLP